MLPAPGGAGEFLGSLRLPVVHSSMGSSSLPSDTKCHGIPVWAGNTRHTVVTLSNTNLTWLASR